MYLRVCVYACTLYTEMYLGYEEISHASCNKVEINREMGFFRVAFLPAFFAQPTGLQVLELFAPFVCILLFYRYISL